MDESKARGKGLGDLVAAAIKKLTRGKVKPCGPCRKRQEKLNGWFRRLTG